MIYTPDRVAATLLQDLHLLSQLFGLARQEYPKALSVVVLEPELSQYLRHSSLQVRVVEQGYG